MNLRKIIFTGVFWSVINQIGVQILGLVTLAFLARLLVPEDFGLIAMVTIATGFLNIIRDFGFGAALVQKKDVTNAQFSTVFWLNIAIGLILTIVFYFLAEPISLFYEEPKIIKIVQVMSFSFLLNSFGVVWGNKLLKDVEFKQIFIRNFSSGLLAGGFAIYFAYKGFGYWALVIQLYVQLISNLFLNYLRVKWLPDFVFERKFLRELFSFSLPLFADKSFNYWMRNLDNLLVGKFLGKGELAFYTKAYSLMLLPVRQLSGTITKVLFPSFSLIQDDPKRIGQIYLKISRVIAFIAFPVMMFLSLSAEPLVLLIYGDQWEPVIPIFQVLSILGMFQAIGTLSGNIFMSRGKVMAMFKLGIFSRIFMMLGVVIGLWQGQLMGMVYGYVISSLLAFIPELYFTGKVINLNLKSIILNFTPYLFTGLGCASMVFYFVPEINMIPLGELLYKGVIFAVLYLSLSFILKLKAFTDLIVIIKSRNNP